MKTLFILFLVSLLQILDCYGYQKPQLDSLSNKILIIRDKYGVAHIKAQTDSAAVFGMMYAQAEDDFFRIELNYLEKLGRLAEIYGPKKIPSDLMNKIIFDTVEAKLDYQNSPNWFKKLLDAFAAGLNYFLAKNPQIKPKIIKQFQPWYPLLWTDGSIGSVELDDITEKEITDFYLPNFSIYDDPKILDLTDNTKTNTVEEKGGSNGFAISPRLSKSGKALLYINPHTTPYFRDEIHIESAEGLNTYGVVTWGQFFIYQGFNQYNGWMHTSNNLDNHDLYYEKITIQDGQNYYEYDKKVIPVIQKKIRLSYLENDTLKKVETTAFYTNKGPVLTSRNGRWVSLQALNRSLNGLIQSFSRTKTKNLNEFIEVMNFRANPSNNTVYADKDGNIVYFHGNFYPIRDTNLDCSKPLDGSISSHNWQGVHPLNETPILKNPPSGFIQNTNSSPLTCAGEKTQFNQQFPTYMIFEGENFRSMQAKKLLSKINKIDKDELIKLAYDPHLSAYDLIWPRFINKTQHEIVHFPSIKKIYNSLIHWSGNIDKNSSLSTIAIAWLESLSPSIRQIYISQNQKDQIEKTNQFMDTVSGKFLLNKLMLTYQDLVKKYGKNNLKFKNIHRYQRYKNVWQQKFYDSEKFWAVSRASGLWGSLASMNTKTFNTKYRYFTGGNSYICVVELGDTIKAKSILIGGVNGNPISPYFANQVQGFFAGEFKDVLYYDSDLFKNISSVSIIKYQ